MNSKLCDCGCLIDWNSHFQRWVCSNCKAWRTEKEQKIVTKYIKLKCKEDEKEKTKI